MTAHYVVDILLEAAISTEADRLIRQAHVLADIARSAAGERPGIGWGPEREREIRDRHEWEARALNFFLKLVERDPLFRQFNVVVGSSDPIFKNRPRSAYWPAKRTIHIHKGDTLELTLMHVMDDLPHEMIHQQQHARAPQLTGLGKVYAAAARSDVPAEKTAYYAHPWEIMAYAYNYVQHNLRWRSKERVIQMLKKGDLGDDYTGMPQNVRARFIRYALDYLQK